MRACWTARVLTILVYLAQAKTLVICRFIAYSHAHSQTVHPNLCTCTLSLARTVTHTVVHMFTCSYTTWSRASKPEPASCQLFLPKCFSQSVSGCHFSTHKHQRCSSGLLWPWEVAKRTSETFAPGLGPWSRSSENNSSTSSVEKGGTRDSFVVWVLCSTIGRCGVNVFFSECFV